MLAGRDVKPARNAGSDRDAVGQTEMDRDDPAAIPMRRTF
jgi:hypothetical protein